MKLAFACLCAMACSRDHTSNVTAPSSVSRTDAVDPRLAQLAYFVGDWTASAENPSTKQSFTLRYTVKPALKGVWLEGTGYAKELDLEIRDYWGIAGNEITRTIFDSSGINARVSSSGWSGNVLMLEGAVIGGPRIRETITKRDDRAFDAVWESNTDGTWVAYSVEHLTR